MDKEIWKDIPGYEGYYQASSMGRIKSLPRKWIKEERILKCCISSTGRLRAGLCINNKLKHREVHQLIAMAFLGHVPCGHKVHVDHIDHNHLNNRLDNLQLITHRENNSKDKHRKGKSSKYTGVCWNKKLGKWGAYIRAYGKQNFLGYYTDEYKAHLAYQEKLKEVNASTFGGLL